MARRSAAYLVRWLLHHLGLHWWGEWSDYSFRDLCGHRIPFSRRQCRICGELESR